MQVAVAFELFFEKEHTLVLMFKARYSHPVKPRATGRFFGVRSRRSSVSGACGCFLVRPRRASYVKRDACPGALAATNRPGKYAERTAVLDRVLCHFEETA